MQADDIRLAEQRLQGLEAGVLRRGGGRGVKVCDLAEEGGLFLFILLFAAAGQVGAEGGQRARRKRLQVVVAGRKGGGRRLGFGELGGGFGLLTSRQIIAIRDQYGVSQKDFAKILGWGGATITRYENHQVQTLVHDDVLRKIHSDPKWFLEMLARSKKNISKKAFKKYFEVANEVLGGMQNTYLIDSIYARYANLREHIITGGVRLNLDKVIEATNYYAVRIKELHKVKLMKLLWYADSLAYKRNGLAITGLVYRAFPLGAVPEGSDLIMYLDGIEFEMVQYEPDRFAYRFYPAADFEVKTLTAAELEILDAVIREMGHLDSREIITRMHGEDAYKKTEEHGFIPFTFVKTLSID